jgi:hypothetical protein
LIAARDRLVDEVEERAAELDGQSVDTLDDEDLFVWNAAGQLDLVRGLEFAPVISGRLQRSAPLPDVD